MNLPKKLQFLREHKVWKCMNKTEVLEEHSSSWKTNGLSSLHFTGKKGKGYSEFSSMHYITTSHEGVYEESIQHTLEQFFLQ